MTIVAILASFRSFSPSGSLLPTSYLYLGRFGVRAPSGNLLLFYLPALLFIENYNNLFKTLEISALIEDTIHCFLMLPNSQFFLSAFEMNVLEVYEYIKNEVLNDLKLNFSLEMTF